MPAFVQGAPRVSFADGARRPGWPTSEAFLQSLLAVMTGEPTQDQGRDDHARRVQPVTVDRLGRGVSRVVREEPDAGRPADPAGRVPEEELPPVHMAETCDPGRRVAQHGDEAAEE